MGLMHKRHTLIRGYRVVFALLAFGAVVTEIATLVERGRFAPVNFFSYFTVLSNVFAAAVLGWSACQTKPSPRLDWLRGAATLYMATTGLVFAVLLSGIKGAAFTAVPWDNLVLHYMMPIVLVVDWLLYPPRRRIAFRRALGWLVFPFVYVAYSLVRGHATGWYPYPFLNPDKHGYAGVAVTSLLVAVVVLGITGALVAVGARRSFRH
jgi:hypothetical protein